MEYKLSQLIGPGFYGSHRAVKQGCLELLESGGRGSGKSSFLSVEFLLQLLRHPGCSGAVLRKVGNTLRTSVYAQLQWAVYALGLGGLFRFSLSPMEAEYLPTGQKILFLGMDDAGKLKSIKLPKGYIGLVWFEELDQFSAEEVRSAEQSLFRGGDYCLSMKSFNPPPDADHWANRYAQEARQGKHIHHSTYLELPQSWLGERFLADAAHLRQVNPTLYANEYLGQCVGTGARVFPNLRLEAIPEDKLDRVVAGVDWGWWPDPWAFNRVCYHSGSRTLYIFDEATCLRSPNRDTGALVKGRIRLGETVIADSSEEKSIDDYRAMGIPCRGAKKGPGSVEYSMKWLQSLSAIVIDPVRCPDTAREFQNYTYAKGTYPDRDNHHIDAVRYATGPFRRRGEV
jgi:PBSX family phage terminase large subunit